MSIGFHSGIGFLHASRIAPSADAAYFFFGLSQYGLLHFGQTFGVTSFHEIVRVFAQHVGLVRRIFTDEGKCFTAAYRLAPHETVNHSQRYVLGQIHVNHVENAWSLFKRGLTGVYHFVSAKYLQEYLTEFAFRYSHRRERNAMVGMVFASC